MPTLKTKNVFVRFWDFLSGKHEKTIEYLELPQEMTNLVMQKLAYEICVQRIAKTICKCEFRVFKKHKEQKDHMYYMLNVRPNPNQSATEFWQRFVEVLYEKQEVLIVEIDENLYIADGYTVDDSKALEAMKFNHVQINNLTLNKTFTLGKEGNASFFRLSNQKVKSLLEAMMSDYTQLLSAATNAYKNSVGIKAKLHIKTKPEAISKDMNNILQDSLKTFFKDPNACFFEYEGYDFQPFSSSSKGTQQSTRDIKAMLDDILEVTCKAFLMPTNLTTGEVADTSKAVDDFLTFCLDPIFSLIEDGLNYSLFLEKDTLKGTKVKINAQAIKHVDILDASSAIDKLVSCGAKSINDILRIMGEEPIEEPWADMHWITKNYTSVTDLAELGSIENSSDQGSVARKEETTDEENAQDDDHENGTASENG